MHNIRTLLMVIVGGFLVQQNLHSFEKVNIISAKDKSPCCTNSTYSCTYLTNGNNKDSIDEIVDQIEFKMDNLSTKKKDLGMLDNNKNFVSHSGIFSDDDEERDEYEILDPKEKSYREYGQSPITTLRAMIFGGYEVFYNKLKFDDVSNYEKAALESETTTLVNRLIKDGDTMRLEELPQLLTKQGIKSVSPCTFATIKKYFDEQKKKQKTGYRDDIKQLNEEITNVTKNNRKRIGQIEKEYSLLKRNYQETLEKFEELGYKK